MKRRKDSHLITGEEMNASCLDTDGKWRYNGGKGDIPEEERKRVKEGTKVVRDTRRKKPWAMLSSRPERERNKGCKLEEVWEASNLGRIKLTET